MNWFGLPTRFRFIVALLGALIPILVLLSSVSGSALAARTLDKCVAAEKLAAARQIDSAVELFNEARTDGEACGSGSQAVLALDAQRQAAALRLEGSAQETLGNSGFAADLYAEALAINAEDAGARAALARLTNVAGLTPPTATPTTTPPPFGAVETFERLGQDEEALKAAIEAVNAGHTPAPGSTAADILAISSWNQGRTQLAEWISAWWPYVIVLVVVTILGWRRFVTSRVGRRTSNANVIGRLVPKTRLAVDASQASGAEPDLSLGFGVRVRSHLHDYSARAGQDPRTIKGTDAPVEVPLDQVPEKVQYIYALWRWLGRSNVITLRATLLPAAQGGLECHVVLIDADGSLTRSVRSPQQVLTHRPANWILDPQNPPTSYQWLPLVLLVSAWGTFAFRSLQIGHARLAGEFGTSDGNAYGELLAGLEAGHDPERAARHYRRAISLDPEFREAHLNLASLESPAWAARRLRTRVLGGLAYVARPTSFLRAESDAEVRLRGLWLRGMYSLIIAEVNAMTSQLSTNLSFDSDRLEALLEIQGLIVELNGALSMRLEA